MGYMRHHAIVVQVQFAESKMRVGQWIEQPSHGSTLYHLDMGRMTGCGSDPAVARQERGVE